MQSTRQEVHKFDNGYSTHNGILMRVVSVFSGIGGFDLGFERAGMDIIAHGEIDSHASRILARHWPDVENLGDITNVRSIPDCDVFCGGFPCQDVSVAGRRAGLDGKRSGLWFEYLRLVEDALPQWVVIENVPGLLSSNGGADFAVILQGLVKCGYGVVWRVLDAQYFGLAQRRKRLFIVGHLGDGRAAQVLFESDSRIGDTAPSREARQGAAANFAYSPETSGALTNQMWKQSPARGMAKHFLIAPFDLQQITSKENRSQVVAGSIAPTMAARSRFHVASIDYRNDRTQDELSGTLQAKPNGGYSLNYINPVAINLKASTTTQQPVRTAGVSGTLKAQPQEGIFTNTYVRRLTPKECERLQGFPDNWTAFYEDNTEQSDAQRYKQLGNAVAVPVAEWIGRRIIQSV